MFNQSRIIIVDQSSASPQLPGVTYYGVEATHSGMCKFDSVDAPGYVTVSTALKEWAEAAPAVIEVRWHVEEREARDRLRDMILEQTRQYVSIFTRRRCHD